MAPEQTGAYVDLELPVALRLSTSGLTSAAPILGYLNPMGFKKQADGA